MAGGSAFSWGGLVRGARKAAAVLLALGGLVLLTASCIDIWIQPDLSLTQKWYECSPVAYSGPLAVVAILIVWKGHATLGNAMLALAIAAVSFSDGLFLFLQRMPVINDVFRGGVDVFLAVLTTYAFLRASQLFPVPLRREDVFAQEAPWARASWLRASLAALLRPWAVLLLVVLQTGLALVHPSASVIFTISTVVLGAAYWHIRHRVGDESEKRQVAWFLQAALLLALAYAVGAILTAPLASLEAGSIRIFVAIAFNYGAALAIVACIYMAVFRAGAVNPNLIVRRTLVYGVSASLLLLALNIVASVLVDEAVYIFGVTDRLAAATAGAIAGLAFDPLAKWLRTVLDRLFDRKRQKTVAKAAPEAPIPSSATPEPAPP